MGLKGAYQEHLLGVAEFLEPAQARRFLTLATGSDKQRQKLRGMLDRLKPSNADFQEGIYASPASILQTLTSLGAPQNCYVFRSNDYDVEGEFNLKEALVEIVYYEPGTIISCIPGKLGFWETSNVGKRCILKI